MLLPNDRNRLLHMIAAIEEIAKFTHGMTRESFERETPVLRLVERNLEILGEAAARVSPECRAQCPTIPWRTIIGLRNRLSHAYFDVDRDIVWATARDHLAGLEQDLRALLESLG